MGVVDSRSKTSRWLFFALGWFFFALGAVGVVLPVLPTTPFMVLALWAFARSSQRFHDWLYNHRTFGPPLRAFKERRVIRLRVKLIAYTTMLASLSYAIFVARPEWHFIAMAAAPMAAGAIYIASCPSR